MKELIQSIPLLLFLGLLIVLSISIYFGNNAKIHESMVAFQIPVSKLIQIPKSGDIVSQNKGTNNLLAQTNQIPPNFQIPQNAQIPSNAQNVPETTTTPAPVQNVPGTTTTPAPIVPETTTTPAPIVPTPAPIVQGTTTTSAPTVPGVTIAPVNQVIPSPPPPPSVDWFTYWNYVASSNDPTAFNSSNMISKTQIIPPVCPQCPQLAGSGACTNCGGLGGSGTSSTCKNRFADFVSTYGSGYKGNGNWAGVGGDQYSNQYQNSYGNNDNPSLSHLAESTGSGAVGLLRDTGSGATGLLRDTGSGTVGLLRDSTSGAVGLLRDAGSGAAGLLRSNPTQLGQINGGSGPYQGQQFGSGPGQGQQFGSGPGQGQGQGPNLPNNPLGIQGIDPYSYNGALVSKGSNYIPVTDDFSAFRK